MHTTELFLNFEDYSRNKQMLLGLVGTTTNIPAMKFSLMLDLSNPQTKFLPFNLNNRKYISHQSHVIVFIWFQYDGGNIDTEQ